MRFTLAFTVLAALCAAMPVAEPATPTTPPDTLERRFDLSTVTELPPVPTDVSPEEQYNIYLWFDAIRDQIMTQYGAHIPSVKFPTGIPRPTPKAGEPNVEAGKLERRVDLSTVTKLPDVPTNLPMEEQRNLYTWYTSIRAVIKKKYGRTIPEVRWPAMTTYGRRDDSPEPTAN